VVVPVFAQPMPKTLRLRAQVVGWISWELTGSDMTLGLRHDDPSAEDDQAIGGAL
jgi:hypothetical protein